MARAARQQVIVVVSDNKAAEALEPMLRAGCELTGAIDPARSFAFRHESFPSRISLPSRRPGATASALWKLATGGLHPHRTVESAPPALRSRLLCRPRRHLRRTEEVDVEVLTAHLAALATRR